MKLCFLRIYTNSSIGVIFLRCSLYGKNITVMANCPTIQKKDPFGGKMFLNY